MYEDPTLAIRATAKAIEKAALSALDEKTEIGRTVRIYHAIELARILIAATYGETTNNDAIEETIIEQTKLRLKMNTLD